MPTVVFTSTGRWSEGYIDYGVSHRFFCISPDGVIGGGTGRIADEYELRLIRRAIADRTATAKAPRRWNDHLPGHVYREAWHGGDRCWCCDKTAEQLRSEENA